MDAKFFQKLTQEIREAAESALKAWPEEEGIQKKINAFITDMDKLQALLRSPDFAGMPIEKRLHLKDSLMKSREQLMFTIQTTPSPTDIIQ